MASKGTSMYQAGRIVGDAIDAAMTAGERAAKRGRKGDPRRWLKRHQLPPLSMEDLMAEAYALGYRLERERMA